MTTCPSCYGEGLVRDPTSPKKLVMMGCQTCGGSGSLPDLRGLRTFRCPKCRSEMKLLMSPAGCWSYGCDGKPVLG